MNQLQVNINFKITQHKMLLVISIGLKKQELIEIGLRKHRARSTKRLCGFCGKEICVNGANNGYYDSQRGRKPENQCKMLRGAD